jgi:hypothetical protein
MYAPLLPAGIAYAPQVLARLWSAAPHEAPLTSAQPVA